IGSEILGALDLTSQEAAAERAVGDESNAEFARGGNNLPLGIARPKGVLRFWRGNGMRFLSAAHRPGTGFRKAEVTHFADSNEIGHGANGFLDGHSGVHAVLIVEVDDVNTEALEAGVASMAKVCRAAADAAGGRIRTVAEDAEFRGEKDF